MVGFWAAIVGLVSALVAAGVMMTIAFTRTATVAKIEMTKRRIVLVSAAPPQAMYEWMTRYCPDGYRVEDADDASLRFVLSSRPTLNTWGFFYPAVVYADPQGSRVELGITSRVYQWGPLVTRAHRKLAQSLATLTNSRVVEG